MGGSVARVGDSNGKARAVIEPSWRGIAANGNLLGERSSIARGSMFLRRYQWVLGVVWLVVAGMVLFRDTLLPPAVLARMRTENGWLIVLMAAVFAGWNFARWYTFANRAVPYCSPFDRKTDHIPANGGKPSNSTG
jgi:hypothetical protein